MFSLILYSKHESNGCRKLMFPYEVRVKPLVQPMLELASDVTAEKQC
jgi:hypothetical protein